MATIVYYRARVLIGDADVSAQLSECSVDYNAEMLDETTFGDDTRIRKGGLKAAKISGKGFFDAARGPLGAEAVLFGNTGTDDTVISLFPDSVTEGSQCGFGMKGVLSEFRLGEGGVGSVLALSFSAESRGIL